MPAPGQFLSITTRLCSPVRRAALTLAVILFARINLQADEPGVAVRLASYDREDFRGELRISLGTTAWTNFRYQGTDKQLETAGLALPPATREIVFHGNLEWTHFNAGAQVSKGTSRRPIVDFTELMRPVRDSRLTWSERLNQFEKAQESFEARYEQLAAEVTPRVDPGERASASQIAAADKRLGFALPPDHARMLLDVGAWSVNDAALAAVGDLQPAFRQMIELWETPTEAMNGLPDKTKTFLQRSVILFTAAGDGYSGLICQPPPPEGQPAAYRYFWLTQDDITSPMLLADRDGTPFDYAQVISWLLANHLIRLYEDVGTRAIACRWHDFGVSFASESFQSSGEVTLPRFSGDWTESDRCSSSGTLNFLHILSI